LALEANYPSSVKQVDLEGADLPAFDGKPIRLSRRTIGSCLKELRRRGLAHRPQGERKGDAITAAGRKLLASRRPVR
jgi:hypothetical protein